MAKRKISLLDKCLLHTRILAERNEVEPRLTFADCRVAWALLMRHNTTNNRCFPSFPTIAKDADTTERTAISAVGKLLARGFFSYIAGGGRLTGTNPDGSGKGRSNEYMPNIKTLSSPTVLNEHNTPSSPTGLKPGTMKKNGINHEKNSKQPCSPQQANPSRNPSREPVNDGCAVSLPYGKEEKKQEKPGFEFIDQDGNVEAPADDILDAPDPPDAANDP